MKLRVGDWVEVRSKEEILSTLDKKGQLEGLPFMPQMFNYCGQRFRVFKSAHKTCDWVYTVKSRRLPNGIHLDLRCDGEAYGGCQTACLIYWKKAWLKPVTENDKVGKQFPVHKAIDSQRHNDETDRNSTAQSICTVYDVLAATHAEDGQLTSGERYICQATQVSEFTTPLPWWDIRQYVEDYSSGNITFWQFIRGFIYAGYNNILRSGIGVGAPMRWLYDVFQSIWGGISYPGNTGTIPVGQTTPKSILNLKQGEMVRVKSFKEIRATLDRAGKNRGLRFDAEMVPYCGGTYRVRTRVTRFIDEKTGELVEMKSDAVILEGAWCRARYSRCRMFCSRSIYVWWREIWLERSTEGSNSGVDRH
jgi:hypothetical protein